MEIPAASPNPDQEFSTENTFRTLKELIDYVSGRSITDTIPLGESGYADHLPFPFLGLVGQFEMKIALALALINPAIRGVLLIGPRGTGKTTAVRGLLDLLPMVQHSTCFYGCLPEDIEDNGIDAVCPECAKKYGQGISFTKMEKASLVELPLNSLLDDVIGYLGEDHQIHARMQLKRGLLAQADRSLLFVDEINLLPEEIVNAILDAAAQGTYTVRRGPISATYQARINLIGSMNPEEGKLRSQILDRFGLRIIVRGLDEIPARLEVYKRVKAYTRNPRQTIAQFSYETSLLAIEIENARKTLPEVEIPEDVARQGITLIKNLQIDSLRAEISLFETARAYTAADGRVRVLPEDIRAVAKMCLRMRHSHFMADYFENVEKEEERLAAYLDQTFA